MARKVTKVLAGFGLAVMLAACAAAPTDEGLVDPQTIAQAFAQEADAAAAPIAPEPKKSPFGFLRKKPAPAEPALLEGKDITVISDAGIAQVTVPEGAVLDVVPEAQLADASIAAPKPGPFGFLRRKPKAATPAPSAQETSDAASIAPLQEEALAAATPNEPRERRGLFGRRAAKPAPIVGLAQEQAQLIAEAPEAVGVAAQIDESDTEKTIAALDAPAPDAPRRGFAALFKRAPEPASVAPVAAALPAAPDATSEETIAALPEPAPAPEAIEKPARRGLFGPRNSNAAGGAKSTVARGEVLPFGQVGVACGLRKSELGREVDHFPKTGKAQWRLFDTNPASTGPRTQFITGFSDNCARQFTASLSLFGAPALHETHRYSSAQRRKAYSQADTAYEAIKSRLCGVGRGKPCPAAKIGDVEKKVAFVSIYHRFGDTKGWLELLLNNGKLETQQLR